MLNPCVTVNFCRILGVAKAAFWMLNTFVFVHT